MSESPQAQDKRRRSEDVGRRRATAPLIARGPHGHRSRWLPAVALCVAVGVIGAALPATALANPFNIKLVKPAEAELAEGHAPPTVTVPPGEGVEYALSFHASTENPVAECGGPKCPATVEWNFGDGSPAETDHVEVGEPFEAVTAAAKHVYAEGEYEATVTITVKTGGQSVVHFKVQAKPSLVTSISAGGVEFPEVEQPVTFTAEQHVEKEVTAPLYYRYLVNSQLVEEIPVAGSSPWKATLTRSFAEPGTYHVLVKAHDSSSPEAKRGSAETVVEVVPKLGGTAFSESSSPEAGQEDFLLAEPSGGRPPYSYAWSADGSPFAGDEQRVKAPFTGAVGTHSFVVHVSDAAKPAHEEELGGNVTVDQPLRGSFSPSSGEVPANEPVTFTAAASGGTPPYSYHWTLVFLGNGAGSAPIASGEGQTFTHTFDTRFESSGSYLVTLTVVDAAAHVQHVQGTVSLPTCVYEAEFGLVQVQSTGCMHERTGSEGEKEWVGESEAKLNGIPLEGSPNHKLTVRAPTDRHPGGDVEIEGDSKVTLPLSSYLKESVTVFDGHVDWSLPAGKQGEVKEAVGLAVPANQEVFHMHLGGEVALKLGFESGENGYTAHYANLGLKIELPSIFKSGPDKTAGGVSAGAAMRIDAAGVHFGGLRLEAENVFVGALELEKICLSDTIGGEAKPCEKPKSIGGKEFIECAEAGSTENLWQGTAVVVLPTPTQTKLAFFGGVVNGKVANLGGFVEGNPGIPIVDDVFLDRVGVGVCINPPPFKLKGEVGVDAMPVPDGPPTIQVGGSFLFTSSFTDSEGNEHPWSIELGGGVNILGKEVGSGDIVVDAYGNLEFELAAHLNLYELVELEGHVGGWIEPAARRFNITGGIHGCVVVLGCDGGNAAFSSVGVAACVFSKSAVGEIEFGFGYKWGAGASGVDIFSSSCDFGPYEAEREATMSSLGGVAPSVTIAPRTKAIALHITGLGAPPRVTLTGPGGTTVPPPAAGARAARGKGYVVVEDPADDATDVLLADPAPGVWKIAPAGAVAFLTGVQSAHYEPPPVAHGSVARARDGRRTLHATVALASGMKMALIERGKGSGGHVLRADAHGSRCPRHEPSHDGIPVRCLSLSFAPALGPGGRREVVGVVTRDGMPVKTITIASFEVPRPALPGRPRVTLLRHGSQVTIGFTRSSDASRYTISVAVSDGRKLGFFTPARCRRVVLTGVAAKSSVSVEVAGVRADMAVGRYTHVLLRGRQRQAGARGRPPRGPLCS